MAKQQKASLGKDEFRYAPRKPSMREIESLLDRAHMLNNQQAEVMSEIRRELGVRERLEVLRRDVVEAD